jgi:hypothetical protein
VEVQVSKTLFSFSQLNIACSLGPITIDLLHDFPREAAHIGESRLLFEVQLVYADFF